MLGVVFMPYFAQTVVGDVVAGQAEVANFAKYAGFAAACTAPLLGALLDQRGPRKPWIVAFMAVLVGVVAMLWFAQPGRSEEHTSELQSLMRISYAVFCLKKKK